jgi:protein SCO1/2
MSRPPSRRALFRGIVGAGVALALPRRARAHNGPGLVSPPATPPATALTFDDGRACTLRDALDARVTALQLVFTRCQATCPIQGALFGRAARTLGDRVAAAQWLSVSLDPAHDTPSVLGAWRGRFGPAPRWRAARPEPRDLPALFEFLNARQDGPDNHTAQVYFFDRAGRLVLRSVDFPSPDTVVAHLVALAARR